MKPSPNRYSVYWKKTGQPLIVGGTAEECTSEMDLTSVGSFWSIWHKIKIGHPKASQKWHIVRYAEDDDDKDRVSVVRCVDCKWRSHNTPDGFHWCDEHERGSLSDDDFCSYGERKYK